MKLRILGCSGGIGGNARTTAMLLDRDVLIDAGTGVADLSQSELSRIEHVFVTHAHLDHIACLPLLVDSAGFERAAPLTIHATQATLEIIRQHVFNWKVWPDFSRIPDERHPLIRYSAQEVGQTVDLAGRRITALPARHSVPAVGFCIDGGSSSLAFSGDTAECPELWEAVNRISNLRYLVVETAFSNRERQVAAMAGHFCPATLAEDMRRLSLAPEIYISHLKPGEADLIMREIGECVRGHAPGMLQNGQVFEF